MTYECEPLGRVDAIPLIAATDDALVSLLRGLESDDWERPAVGKWSVRNLAAHLLDGNVRRLSVLRDGLVLAPPSEPIADYASLVAFLNRLNDDWIRATARLSGRIITDWLEVTNPQVRGAFAELDPEGPAPFPVDWAGQDETSAWLDIAREYTEKWHHQQQIRNATAKPGLTERFFVEPLLDTLVRALPRTYARAIPEGVEATVVLSITDFPGCRYLLERKDGLFQMFRFAHESRGGPTSEDTATIRLQSDTAWRVFMKGMSATEARSRAEVTGPSRLTDPFFDTLAVMA